MASPETSAPAAPAPAPAAGGGNGGAGPSWGGGSVSTLLDRASGASAPAAPVTPAPVAAPAAAPAAAAPAAPPKPAGAAPAKPALPTDLPKPAEPAKPGDAAPVVPTAGEELLAGRFKTQPELVDAYHASGKEARRLLDLSKGHEKTIQETAAKVAELSAQLEAVKLEKQLGPEIVDPSAEESANWDGQKWAKHESAKVRREQLKDKLEKEAKSQTEEAKRVAEGRVARVFQNFEKMSKDSEQFPRFKELESSMDEFLELLPAVKGHPNAPLLLYLAAEGHRALQSERESKKASAAALLKAKEEAGTGQPAAGGAGAGGSPTPEPLKPTDTPAPDSDAAHNARLITAGQGSRSNLPKAFQ